MGLTLSSVGMRANTKKIKTDNERVVAIAGNPNVGKSTIFNSLTGMHQHTGNWPGKTVTNAIGDFKTEKNSYTIIDIPGTYSLISHSPEEEVARDFLCFSSPQAVIIVCDATCLERNLNLVLQILEVSDRVIVCVNLLDEANRKGIKINLQKLSRILNVPVIGTVGKDKKSIKKIKQTLDKSFQNTPATPVKVDYGKIIESAVNIIETALISEFPQIENKRWVSLKLLEANPQIIKQLENKYYTSLLENTAVADGIKSALAILSVNNIRFDKLSGILAETTVKKAEEISKEVSTYIREDYTVFDRKTDKILTSKRLGYPLMILLLGVVFWLTISGANYISSAISCVFDYLENGILYILGILGAPPLLKDFIIEGLFRVPSWVVSVMLPPMAIFFPLFTLLEDVGYLPRIAFNLDKPFKKCSGCGKQALTMCMGFGCNAAGVVGCRIIDSKRERLLAILTNSLVPCNGRFPALITVISIFIISTHSINTAVSALLLTVAVMTGIAATFLVTKFLSMTFLKGTPSSYILEMPPYRKPNIGQIVIRSVFDRTLFVLLRAVTVALPAGIVIWFLTNITVNNISLLNYCTEFLDPFASFFGLDGVLLTAFILGLPANEIVLPIAIMVYSGAEHLTEIASITAAREIFIANGWTPITAICTVVFILFHWPCSTTLITIKKETGSLKWTALSLIIPTALGIITCAVLKFIYGMLSLHLF